MSELRKRLHTQIGKGDSPTDTAERFNVSRNAVYAGNRLLNETGGFSHRPSTGRPRSTQAKAIAKAIEANFKENTHNNIRKIARELNVDKSAVYRAMRKELGMKSRTMTKVQAFMANQRQKRQEMSRTLLSKFKKGDKKVLVFSDEKIFSVDAISNSRSTRYIA